MEEQLLSKHRPGINQRQKYNDKTTRPNFVRGKQKEPGRPRKKRKAKPLKYGIPKVYATSVFLTQRARHFIELMGGLSPYIEQAAIYHAAQHPSKYTDIPSYVVRKGKPRTLKPKTPKTDPPENT
jgi:hypothetical protein